MSDENLEEIEQVAGEVAEAAEEVAADAAEIAEDAIEAVGETVEAAEDAATDAAEDAATEAADLAAGAIGDPLGDAKETKEAFTSGDPKKMAGAAQNVAKTATGLKAAEDAAKAGKVAGNSAESGAPTAKKSKKKLGILAAVVAVIAIASVGMFIWHEQPSFCSTMCHIEADYVDNYMQEQGVPGTDKYGHAVSNTNAMMAVLHRNTRATAKPEIVCVDCHIPNFMELAHDGVNYVTGNYPYPRDERSTTALGRWDNKLGTEFCANENCHVYLLGDDGKLDMKKLSDSTAGRAFNFHEQHHENLTLDCSSCHKGHRASTVVCTGCHEHENVALPDGWVTYSESEALMHEVFA